MRARHHFPIRNPSIVSIFLSVVVFFIFWLLPVTTTFAQEFSVTWTDLVGVTVSGNTITKSTAAAWGNSGAASTTRFSGNGGVKFTATETTTDRMCGLSAVNANADYTTMAYALYLVSNSTIQVYESGALKGTFGTYKSGDVFTVDRSGSTVFYKKNGSTFYSSGIPSSGPLLVDSALYSSGAMIADARIIGVTPAAPSAVADLYPSAGDAQVELFWNAPSDNGSPITGYDIQYGTVASGGFGTTVSDDALPGRMITGLTNGVAYQFRVIAKNALGNSAVSNVVPATPASGLENNVTWVDAVGVTVSENSITKTAAAGWGNAGAASSASFGGDGGVDFAALQTNANVMCGLSAKNTDANSATIDYALYPTADNAMVQVYEKGALKGTFGTYQAGDRFRVERTGSGIFYKKNGTVLYTSTVASSGKLLVDSAIYTPAGAISRAKTFGFAPRVPDAVNDFVAAGSGNGEVQFLWTEPANYGAVITGYDIQYGTVASGGFASVFADDAMPGATVPGLTNDVPYQFRIVAKNSHGSAAPSNAVTATPLFSFPVTWTDAVGVNVSGSSITKTSGTGWGNSGAASVASFGGNGGVDFSVPQMSTAAMIGLSSKNTNANYTTIDYALHFNGGGALTVHEKGVYLGTVSTYQLGDRFRVERVGTTVYYKKNGSVVYTSAVASAGSLLADAAIYTGGGVISDAKMVGFNPGVPNAIADLDSISGNAEITLTWSAPANNGAAITGYDVQYGTVASGGFSSTYADDAAPGAAITGLTNDTAYQFRVVAKNSYGSSGLSNVKTATPTAGFPVTWTDAVGVSVSGSTITKTAGTAWGNSGATSVATFSGSGGVDFTVPQTNAHVMCGLSDQNVDANYPTIDYALYPTAAAKVQVYENGAYRGTFGTYVIGDRLRVERMGSTVYYKKNGTVLYTSTIPSSGKLQVDSALYTSGGAISDAKVVGFAAVAPDAVSTLNGGAGDGTVSLTWTAPANNGAAITGYDVEYGTVASGAFGSVYTDDAVAGATITGLTNDTPYQFRVIAKNSFGSSSPSNVKTIAPTAGFAVAWTDAVGVSVSGNSITKTAGTAWGNSGAASVTTFSGNGGVDFTVPDTNANVMCGLSDQNVDANYTTMDYAMFPIIGGEVRIYENGVYRGAFGSYAGGDRFKVERLGSTVYYKKNGTVIYTSTVPSSGRLLVDSAIYSNGGMVSDARVTGFAAGVPDTIADLNISLGNSGEVKLTWTAPANNGTAITGYDVQYGTVAGGGFGSTYIDDAVAGATVTGLTNDTAYQFRVVAKNSYGSSVPSSVKTATPLNRTLVNSDITTNTTWTTAGSPYVIAAPIKVVNGVTLTIQPGVAVKFDGNHQLQVDGTLNASGTAGNEIVFTSNSATPAASNWQQINFTATSGASVMNYTRVEYAAYGIYMNGPSVPVQNSTIQQNYYGMYLVNRSSPNINGNIIRNNTNTGIRMESGASPLIQNNQIINNASYGLVLYGPSTNQVNPVINNNLIYGHSAENLWTSSVSGDQSGLKINARNNWWGTAVVSLIAAEIYDYTEVATSPVVDFSQYLDGPGGAPAAGKVISGPMSVNETWAVTDSPCRVVGNVTVKPGVTLTIAAGVEVKFDGNYYLLVNGTLAAAGQSNNPIVFTSGRETVTPGDWQYIALSGTSSVSYAQIEYASQGIRIDNASPSVQNSVLRHNTYGIYILNGSSSAITSNKITNNAYGIYLYPSTSYTLNPSINVNDIYNNTSYNVYASGHQNFSAMTINAENNWWGTTDLPTIAAKIYDKTDNANSPLVDVDPIATGADTITISGISASPMFFTPRSGQTSVINYTLDQAGDATIKIYAFSPNQPVRTLINNQPRPAGANSEIWNGKNDQGQDLPNGVYYYTISVRDSTGRYGEYDPVYVGGSVTLQTPSVTPANINAYQNEQATVNYSLPVPGWLTLRVGVYSYLATNATRTMINNEPQEAAPQQAFWDGRDDLGRIAGATGYYFYAWSTILPDNAIVIRPDAGLKIDPLTVSPYAIYQRYGERASIAYTVTTDAVVTVDILDPGGALFRTLASNQFCSASTVYEVTWDGKDNFGRIIAGPGDYTVRITATDPSGFTTRTRFGNISVF